MTISELGPGIEVDAPRRARAAQPRTVRAGFIPLVDASVLIVAAELGFAEREGVRLDLVKDVSWSNIRDRLAFRQFDVAHMLNPMPIASQLALGSNPFPVIAPFSLGLGGNAITLSVDLYRQMQEAAGLAGAEDAMANGRALKAIVEGRRARGEPMLAFAMTYPFSSHNYEFRYWMGAAGIHPDRDVRMVVVPPPLTADALLAGAIDGFCVGAPWNMLAVEAGVGRIVATKPDLWPSSPEKVIGVRHDWAELNRETLAQLIVALDAAARWCDEPGNRDILASILARPAYIGAPVEILKRVLSGEFTVDPNGTMRQVDDYFVFHRKLANFPFVSHALWTYSQMVRWGQTGLSAKGLAAATAAYRPDIYRAALAGRTTPLPLADSKREGEPNAVVPSDHGGVAMGPDAFCDGRLFDPAEIEAYIAGFEIHNRDCAPGDAVTADN
ncbi:CmpA/NrtA family ABC transporter substrate-binding protein [Methylobrevis albus]|uniref:ABC transporter substrate-binding protein n=1 Tax=Methylobrevis albus TaxID=2793297 RepID=A0A931MXF9_9HYPH|nr:CmpA/NrtA family ABC transporter substrate-binding protein [Methylobrevis albus]MBH0238988.1 ABC transporter substrate-binding protein [Methylobrevis albus]